MDLLPSSILHFFDSLFKHFTNINYRHQTSSTLIKVRDPALQGPAHVKANLPNQMRASIVRDGAFVNLRHSGSMSRR